MFSNLLQSYPCHQEYTIPKNWGFITDNHIHHKIHEYLFLGIKPKIISITNFVKKASMIKLTHHEMPVNKTLHHRTIEILTVLTLLIGSPSFLIYFYCSHDTNNPLCQWLLCTLNHTPEDGEYLYNRYLVISIT